MREEGIEASRHQGIEASRHQGIEASSRKGGREPRMNANKKKRKHPQITQIFKKASRHEAPRHQVKR